MIHDAPPLIVVRGNAAVLAMPPVAIASGRRIARADDLRRAGAAAARQRWQRLKRRAGSAEMVEQRAKGAWADILTADEPQPVEPLLIR